MYVSHLIYSDDYFNFLLSIRILHMFKLYEITNILS